MPWERLPCTAIAGSSAWSWPGSYCAGAPSSPYAGYAAISPIGNTIGALICFFGFGFFPILIVSLILKALGLLRVPREAEILGLDFVGEEAYEAAIAEVQEAERGALAALPAR